MDGILSVVFSGIAGGVLGGLVSFLQLRVYREQLRSARTQVELLRNQVSLLLEARKAKLYALKLAVRSIYDECQDVEEPPKTSYVQIKRLSLSALSELRGYTDTFVFKEIEEVSGLPQRLERLGQTARDVEKSIHSFLVDFEADAPVSDVHAIGKDISKLYDLSGECMGLLDQIK